MPICAPKNLRESWFISGSDSWSRPSENITITRQKNRCEIPIFEPKAKLHFRPLEQISKAIDDAKNILELKDNWDDEGSPSYALETWKRATQFVLNHAQHLWDSWKIVIEAPSILPGPDASIDIHWDTPDFRMLINVPAASTEPITFYGDDRNKFRIKDKWDSELHPWLLAWLKGRKNGSLG